MMIKKQLLFSASLFAILSLTGCVKLNCPLPEKLSQTIKQETLASASSSFDIKQNNSSMAGLCASRVSFYDQGKKWTLVLVRNIRKPNGPFWYLPHDNEDTAYEAAVYAAKKYGGGFLALEANGNRYALGKDPNRNFKAGSTYTKNIFKIINTFKPKGLPYLALHNNKNGHMKYGGEGTVSMRSASAHNKSYPSGILKPGGLNDEDNLVYLSGRRINSKKIQALNAKGVNVKYEVVNSRSNDNSMSNYIALHKNGSGYVNIEAQDGDITTQKKMIDSVMTLVYQKAL